ncbi:AsmA family protein [Leptospira perolatii]|uniref:AsmA family protein n=1 Tax=Leptospira perolatii TaxID=2023191 RepID=A0A2M9ZRP1_9LEPT|nr:AsmA family protein [Leptospira perolatii]PJZ71152.1 AsmA family protein [Leptospira perolatii]PJZ74685.1 AsmA family protein [Leptospira perolatii]
MRSWDVLIEFLRRNKIYYFSVILFFLLLFIVFAYIPFAQRKETYKQYILSELRSATGLDIDVDSSDLSIFPFPGIDLENVYIRNDNILLAVCNRIELDISWVGLLSGNIELRSVQIDGGSLRLQRKIDGTIDLIEFIKNRENNSQSEKISKIEISPEEFSTGLDVQAKDFFRIGLKNVEISNFTLWYTEESHKREYKVYFHKSKASISFYEDSLDLLFHGKIDEQPIRFESTASILDFPIKYEKIRFSAVLNVEDLSLSLLRDVFSFFPLADFSQTKFSGRIAMDKEEDSPIHFKVRSQTRNLCYKGGNPFGNVKTDVDFDLDLFGKRINFPYIEASWEGVAKVSAKGNVNWKNRTIGQFTIRSDYGDYHSILKISKLFKYESPKTKYVARTISGPPSLPGVFYFNVDLNNIYAFKHRFSSIRGDAKYIHPVLTVPSFHAYIYNGEIVGKAKIFPLQPKMEVEGEAFRLHIDKAILPYVKERIITGDLYSKFYLETMIKDRSRDTVAELLLNMKSRGTIEVLNGELLGYANFMIPVLNTLGKIISFSGIDGRQVQFSKLTSEYSIYGNRFRFTKLELNGSGLEVDARGSFGFDNTIDMILNLRLGGQVVGKALKIPILYKGTFGKTIPYIDPIWLGSVFAGSTLLAPYLIPLGGPYGGGVAGSVIGEYVRDLWEGVKGLFGGSEEEIKKQNRK